MSQTLLLGEVKDLTLVSLAVSNYYIDLGKSINMNPLSEILDPSLLAQEHFQTLFSIIARRYCTVTGGSQYSADLPQDALEIPCSLLFTLTVVANYSIKYHATCGLSKLRDKI